MHDSRCVAQPPAELSVSGRFLAQTTNPSKSFVCPACGGGEYVVETRRGFEVRLRELRPYQRVAMSFFPDCHEVLTCVHCPAVFARAHARTRDEILIQLMFSARELAVRQIALRREFGRTELICVDCRCVQLSDSYLRHTSLCRTGRVLRTLEALMAVDAAERGETVTDELLAEDAGEAVRQ